MAITTTPAKTLTTKKGPFFELPAQTKLQTVKRGIGLVLPSTILRYYGIEAAEFHEAEIYIVEGGVYVRFISRRADFQ